MRIYNNILLSEPPFFRRIVTARCVTFTRDASSFPFIVEELTSSGAVGISIPHTSLSVLALDSLPMPLKRRVKIVDKDGRILTTDRTIREPIMRDLGVKRTSDGFGLEFRQEAPEKITRAVCCLDWDWYRFLLGLEYGLQIDVDILKMRRAIELLRRHAHDPEVRGILATFAGVLSTYRPQGIEVIEVLPDHI